MAAAVVTAAHDPTTALHTLVGDDAAAYVDLAARVGSYEGWVAATDSMVSEAAATQPS